MKRIEEIGNARSGTATTLVVAFACVVAIATEAVQAGEVEDGMRAAYQAYQDHDMTGTVERLRAVLELVEEQVADEVVEVLPASLGKWTGETPRREEIAWLGGGVFVERTYRLDEKSATVKVARNSPLLDHLAALLANDELLELGDLETHRISGETAVVEDAGGDGADGQRLRMSVDGRVLVEVAGGPGVRGSELVALARKLDVRRLRAMK